MSILKPNFTKKLAVFCLSLSLSSTSLLPSYALDADTPPALKPIFADSCTSDKRKVLLKAHSNMDEMLELALNATSEELNSVEYKESFGEPELMRDLEVLARLLMLRFGVSLIQLNVECPPASASVDSGCVGKTMAVVPPQKRGKDSFQHTINFCDFFFKMNSDFVQKYTIWTKVSEMQAGTFLHELVHLSWATKELLTKAGLDFDPRNKFLRDQKGGKDEGYGKEGVEDLAEYEPEVAVLNPDSYHIFVMRLAIRKGIIYN